MASRRRQHALPTRHDTAVPITRWRLAIRLAIMRRDVEAVSAKKEISPTVWRRRSEWRRPHLGTGSQDAGILPAVSASLQRLVTWSARWQMSKLPTHLPPRSTEREDISMNGRGDIRDSRIPSSGKPVDRRSDFVTLQAVPRKSASLVLLRHRCEAGKWRLMWTKLWISTVFQGIEALEGVSKPRSHGPALTLARGLALHDSATGHCVRAYPRLPSPPGE
jgi:hypothetical protein